MAKIRGRSVIKSAITKKKTVRTVPIKKAAKKKKTTKRPSIKNYDSAYFAKAGHLHIMSELLLLKWNVAMPEVDIGDDIFVVRDRDGAFIKVQVKSANLNNSANTHHASFSTSYKQMVRSGDGKLIYCFLIRSGKTWDRIVLIERSELWAFYRGNTQKPRKLPEKITIRFNYTQTGITWKGTSLDTHISKWDYFDHHKPKV